MGAGRIVSGDTCSRAGFHDQLGYHFELKIAGVSMASTVHRPMIAMICPAAMHHAGSIMQICAYWSASALFSSATSIPERLCSSMPSMSCNSESLRAP